MTRESLDDVVTAAPGDHDKPYQFGNSEQMWCASTASSGTDCGHSRTASRRCSRVSTEVTDG